MPHQPAPPGADRETRVSVLLVMGTRPEIIKLAPVYWALRDEHPDSDPIVVLTGQHDEHARELCAELDMPVDVDFGIQADRPAALLGRCLESLDALIVERQPSIVVVQGDTSSTLAGAIAGFYGGVPVAHVEAGLRTGDLAAPFPEEGNRKLITAISAMHFPPTESALQRLLAEDVSADRIALVGNTVVDAVRHIAGVTESGPRAAGVHVLVTIHRRENWGAPFERMCVAIRDLVLERNALRCTFVMHPNPALQERARAILGDVGRIELLLPMGYTRFVELLKSADVILTDSGGIQEEAVSLEKPLVVLRRSTERAEGVEQGVAVLGGDTGHELASDVDAALALDISAHRDLYGDGTAGRRIAAAVASGRIGAALDPIAAS